MSLAVDRLFAAAPVPLRSWMGLRGAAIEAALTRVVGLHRASKAVQEILASVDRAVERRDLPSITDKKPIILDHYYLQRAPLKALGEAVEILKARGWDARLSYGAGSSAPPDIRLVPSPDLVTRWRLDQANRLAGVQVRIPAPPAARHEPSPKGGGWFRVGPEVWMVDGSADRADRTSAGRYVSTIPIPANYVPMEPLEWAKEAASAAYDEFRDFPAFAGKTARQVLEPFVPAENRYGLTGICWSGDVQAATDGNRVHAVYVPQNSGDALDGVMWDRWTWPRGRAWGGRHLTQGFNAGPGWVAKVAEFPDFRMVVEHARSGWSWELSVRDQKRLRKIATAAGRSPEGIVFVEPDGRVYARTSKGPKGEPERVGVMEPVKGRNRVVFRGLYLAEALTPFIEAGQPIVATISDRLAPCRFDQPGVQYHVLMPVRDL